MATEIKPPIKYDMVWTMYGKRADFFGIAERFHIDPVTARVIRNRDVITDEEIVQLSPRISCNSMASTRTRMKQSVR